MLIISKNDLKLLSLIASNVLKLAQDVHNDNRLLVLQHVYDDVSLKTPYRPYHILKLTMTRPQ